MDGKLLSGTLADDLRGVLARRIAPSARVLEIGCGDGGILAAVPGVVREGVEDDPTLAAVARERSGVDAVVTGDLLARPSGTRFDAVILDRLVHDSHDVQRLFETAAAHLAPTGRVYVTCVNPAFELAPLGGRRARNWFGPRDIAMFADLADLVVVATETRMLVPPAVPGIGAVANKLSRLPLLRRAAIYSVYVLAPRNSARAKPAPVPSVSVIVPTRNEAGNIQAVLDRTPVMGSATEIIFVEGGSTDDTWATLQRAVAAYRGPHRVSCLQQGGKGKGDAVRVGFAAASGDMLMILDADLAVPPEDLPKFYDVMTSGRADYVQGTRLQYAMEDGAMRPLNRLGNQGFSQLFTFLLDQPVTDTLCGTKVLWARDYERIRANRARFGEFDPFGDYDLIFGAAHLGLRFAEIPIRYRARVYGETNIQRFRHGLVLLKVCAVAATKIKFV